MSSKKVDHSNSSKEKKTLALILPVSNVSSKQKNIYYNIIVINAETIN